MKRRIDQVQAFEWLIICDTLTMLHFGLESQFQKQGTSTEPWAFNGAGASEENRNPLWEMVSNGERSKSWNSLSDLCCILSIVRYSLSNPHLLDRIARATWTNQNLPCWSKQKQEGKKLTSAKTTILAFI